MVFSLSAKGQGTRTLYIQVAYGVEAEIGVGEAAIPTDAFLTSKAKPLYAIGAFVQLPIAGSSFNLKPQLRYRQTQIRAVAGEVSSASFSMNSHLVEIPLQLQYYPVRDSRFLPFIFVEPFVGYCLGAKAEGFLFDPSDIGLPDMTLIAFNGNRIESEYLNRFEFGTCVGLGIEWRSFQFSVSYRRNFNKIGKERPYSLYEVGDSKYQNLSLSIGIFLP